MHKTTTQQNMPIHKRHARVIIAHSAQQMPNFTSKNLIIHTIIILNIHNYEQKEKKEKRRGKERRFRMIIPG